MAKKINSKVSTEITTYIAPEVVDVQLDTIPEDTNKVEEVFTKFTFGTCSITTTEPIAVSTLLGVLNTLQMGQLNGVTPVTTKNKIPEHLALHKSTIESPVKFFHSTIESVVASGVNTRKDIIEHYVALGMSYYTVRTQYQVWFSLNKKGQV